MAEKLTERIKDFPDSSGVYLMRNDQSKVIYIGKATSLKERVRSYFSKNILIKTEIQMREVSEIEFIETESVLEALLLESRLIRKFNPKYNIREKDDKSRLYVNITKEQFPRIELVRETDLPARDKSIALYGPFLSGKSVADALDFIRKIIPFRSCKSLPKKKCLYGRIGLCEAPCVEEISEREYKNNIRKVRDFFEGKKSRIQARLKKELNLASRALEFEKAAKIRDQIYALEHIKQMFFLSREDVKTVFKRVEGYDISNISGSYATGSMVVFIDGIAEKSEYRKFKIKWVRQADDTAMMQEVLLRRFRNNWPKPDLILIDGGRGQVNAVVKILDQLKLEIPVVGLAKGKDRKKDEIITGSLLPRNELALFRQVRDEAHRFAKNYYQKLHRKALKK